MNLRSNMLTVAILIYVITTDFAAGMVFEIDGNIIRATGTLNGGDTRLFFDGVGSDIRSEVGGTSYVIHLDSDGGSLIEGMALGAELKERRIVSHIAHDSRCLSACAFAFLGGTRQYVTGIGPMRELEWGAQLGFHGFFSDNEQVAAVNEILSETRAINAILFEYTQLMGSIDYAWVADALTSAPDDMVFVDSPQDLSALTIIVLDGPQAPPDDWDTNLCLLLMREILPNEDDVAWRLIGFNTIYYVSDIIDLIASPVLSAYGVAPDVITGDSAINLVVGNGFRLDNYRPILDARQRRLERTGFYYDYCVSFISSQRGFSALVDQLSGRIHYIVVDRRSPNSRENIFVWLFNWTEALWINP